MKYEDRIKPIVAGENPTVEPNNGIIRSRDAKVSSTKNIAKHIKIIFSNYRFFCLSIIRCQKIHDYILHEEKQVVLN